MAKSHKKDKLGLSGVQLDLFSTIGQIEEIRGIEKNENNIQEVGINLNTPLWSLNWDEDTSDPEEASEVEEVNGLIYMGNFISKTEHDLILGKIDGEPWLTELKRRVQHYGYKYDYAKHDINRSMYIAPLPDWALEIAQRLHQTYSPTLPDQVIVNEYEPGQGIANHTDCRKCFKETIISLSLGSQCIMDFTNPKSGLKKSIRLEPRSLIVMKGEARYEWTHGIAKRKSDKFECQVFQRSRRVSLTFRTVIIPD